ncbi:hypothetical protein [Mycolicibacterium bacteremicum]|uniref:Uncharacterized protein n=1 Tax=Mycolicibacterium bacteremicum TaxID=564198 RepID=A0A1W9YVM6_MYCBA|nr:hypothetical protein [Mycolicibacterium bacteremicum]MCV7434284.1 hypothetical protein [Mycolicibacterium bacteremicum]ORA04039.1 hypothetical protein BST17_16280 [Mycolicibacterium bacteremicum]
MAILSGFAPWIVYWILVGNVPFPAAVLVALAVAVASFVIGRVRGARARTLEIGAIATFVVLAVLTLTTSQAFMERWIQPLSAAGILLVALIGVLAGRPFVREFAEADQSPEVIKSELFGRITTLVTWIWVAAFAAMTVSAAIPPIVYGDATILDTRTPLSFVCYWVLPFAFLGAAVLAGRVLTERMVAEATSPHTVRKSTFVAFKELEIDQLYYLARERAEREAGPDLEAYDVKLGSQGVPLTGDESRESWPMSYKLRERRIKH